MTRLTILADDLTGAADTGAQFAQSGLDTRISLSEDYFPDCDVLILTSESRHLPPERAFERVYALADQAGRAGKLGGWVYKKIDSTLRGSPGEELAALMLSTGLRQALVCPAFPAQGRLTRNGVQHAPGLDPIELRPLFARARLAVRLGLPGDSSVEGIWIADAESDADLERLAASSRDTGLRLLCGSAGLARPLASLLSEGVEPVFVQRPTARRGLIVTGSRSPVTARQVEFLCAQGYPLWQPDPASILNPESFRPGSVPSQSSILSTTRLAYVPGEEAALARLLAAAAARLVMEGGADALVLTGGDIAAAVCVELQASAICLGGEVQPGIAWGRLEGGLAPGLSIITKAGAFGGEDALFASVLFLTS